MLTLYLLLIFAALATLFKIMNESNICDTELYT